MPTQDFTSTWKKSFAADSAPEAETTDTAAETSIDFSFATARDTVEPIIEKTSSSPKSPAMSGKKPFFKRRGFWIGLGVVFAVLLLIAGTVGAVGFSLYQQGMAIKADAYQGVAEARLAYDAFKGQNLPQTREQLVKVGQSVDAAYAKYQKMKWVGSLPIAKTYYEDGDHAFLAAQSGVQAGLKVLGAIEPHADVLGFTGEGTFTGNTEDRIGLVLTTLGQIAPVLDDISSDVNTMESHIQAIDPQDYPEAVRGIAVRSRIDQAHQAVGAAKVALSEFRPAVERLPAIAGSESRKKYLVIFQNDNELRPTGGFMTAYAVVFVEKGKVTPEKSDDIYELDKRFGKKPAIPEQLGRFLTTEKKWNLRDMNIDPNFKNSMQTVYEAYQKIPGEPGNIDGIIAVDTNVLEKVVEVLGPVEVPGYGVFSTEIVQRCDCPQIIYALSEIIDRPTPYLRENRKGILAPMMQAIIQKTYATQRDKWPQLAEILWQGIEGRHVQMYFFNEADQRAAESIDAAGIIPVIPEGSDYLTVIDANLGGAKSNLFVETSGVQTINGIADGKLSKDVELTYRNTHPASNCNLEAGELCLNGRLNDWTRWYLPKGAEVQSVAGLEEGYKLDTTNPNYDVLEGIFKLEPMGQTKVKVSYTVPYTNDKEYRLVMQKQGGTNEIPFTLSTPWGEQEVSLIKDLDVRLPL